MTLVLGALVPVVVRGRVLGAISWTARVAVRLLGMVLVRGTGMVVIHKEAGSMAGPCRVKVQNIMPRGAGTGALARFRGAGR